MSIKTGVCLECGVERVLGAMTDGVCILCREGETTPKKGRPSNTKPKGGIPKGDLIRSDSLFLNKRSSAGAISTVDKANTFFAVVTVAICIFLLLLSPLTDTPISMVLAYLFLIILTWLVWASYRMVIGMAQDIRAGANELEAIRRLLENRS